MLDAGKVRSVRCVTAADRIGFSLHFNEIADGDGRQLWYKHHWEANYVVAGEATLEDLDHGDSWPLRAGSLYTVGPTDRHRLTGQKELRIVSVFCPALQGDEAHDEDGAYTPSGEVPAGQERLFLRDADALRAAGQEMVVANGEARTLRLLVKDDRVGFSLSDVHVAAGGPRRALVQEPLGGEPGDRRAGQGHRSRQRARVAAQLRHHVPRGAQGPARPREHRKYARTERILSAARRGGIGLSCKPLYTLVFST